MISDPSVGGLAPSPAPGADAAIGQHHQDMLQGLPVLLTSLGRLAPLGPVCAGPVQVLLYTSSERHSIGQPGHMMRCHPMK